MSVLEIISKGSFEVMADSTDDRPPSLQSSVTSLRTRADNQLSLEYLPPEEPHYGGFQHQLASELSPDTEESQHSSEGQDSSELYSRIQELSEKIRTVRMELGDLEDGEAVKSDLGPLFHSERDDEERVKLSSRTSSGSDDRSSKYALVPVEGPITTEIQRSQDSLAYATNISSPLPVGETRTKSSETDDCYSSLDSTTTGKDGVSVLVLQGPSSESPSYPSRSSASVEESQESKRHPLQADLKLQKAIEKMKKLDTKLADLTKKEKEVKRQRMLLEQQMESVSSSSSSGALVSLETGESMPPTSPVFHTQLDENCSNAGDYPSGSTQQDDLNAGQVHGQKTESESTKPNPRQSQENHGGVDYIKRNIELASEAGATLAMTEAERKRLEELLGDDELEDPYAFPPALTGVPGIPSGFQYSDQEEERMRDIDSRLQALMPPEDWQSICSSSRNTTPAALTQMQTRPLPDESNSTTSVSDTSTITESIETGKHIGPGEEVLQQFQVSREENQKLKEIEEQLSAIWEEKAREAEVVPTLPASQLQALVEQCKREQSSITRDHSHSQPEDNAEFPPMETETMTL